MHRWLFVIFIFLSFSLYLFAAKTLNEALNSNNDHGFWLMEEANLNFNNHWSASFNMEQRWGSDYRLFWYQRFEALFDYDLTEKIKEGLQLGPEIALKLFSIGGGCAQVIVIQKNTLGEFHEIGLARPEIDLKADFGWNDLILKQRLRIEYQYHYASHYKNPFIYRWRLSMDSPRSFTRRQITPYIQNEFFFRNETYSKTNPHGLVGNLYQDRLRVGLKLFLIKDVLKTDLYWQWRPFKQRPGTHPRWINTYQFGMSIHWYYN